MKNSTTKKLSITAAGALVLGLSLSVTPAFAESQATLDPIGLVPQLATSQDLAAKNVALKLPEKISADVNLDSVRILSTDGDVTYSTSTNLSGREVCLLISVGGAFASASSACMPAEQFAHHPISMGVEGPPKSGIKIAAYLFQEDVDVSPIQGAEVSRSNVAKSGQSGVHLVVDRKDGSIPERASLSRKANSASFEFTNVHLLEK